MSCLPKLHSRTHFYLLYQTIITLKKVTGLGNDLISSFNYFHGFTLHLPWKPVSTSELVANRRASSAHTHTNPHLSPLPSFTSWVAVTFKCSRLQVTYPGNAVLWLCCSVFLWWGIARDSPELPTEGRRARERGVKGGEVPLKCKITTAVRRLALSPRQPSYDGTSMCLMVCECVSVSAFVCVCVWVRARTYVCVFDRVWSLAAARNGEMAKGWQAGLCVSACLSVCVWVCVR